VPRLLAPLVFSLDGPNSAWFRCLSNSLQGRAVLAAQQPELGLQCLDLFVEPLMFSIEEAGRLSYQFRILNLLETQDDRILEVNSADDLLISP
jgi:hypothetical protein